MQSSLWGGILGIAALCLSGFPPWSAAAHTAKSEKIVVAVIGGNVTHAVAGAVMEEAYRRINVPMEIRHVPAKRALTEANLGIVDADAGRIRGTEEKFPNLLVVRVPVTSFRAVAYTIHVKADIGKWDDLAPYRISIQRGIRYSDIGTRGMDRHLGNSSRELMQMLVRGHADIAVTTEVTGRIALAKHFEDSGIHITGRALHEAKLYHMLHNSHAELVPKLARMLERMAAEGRLWEIRQRKVEEMSRQ